jgi:hypothetical protein
MLGMLFVALSLQPSMNLIAIDHRISIALGHGSDKMRFDFDKERLSTPYLRCEANGHSWNAVLDTGCQYSIIDSELAKSCKFLPGKQIAEVLIPQLSVDGYSFRRRWPNVPVFSQNLEIFRSRTSVKRSGVFGTNFCSLHGAVIDYKERLLYLKKPLFSLREGIYGKWKAITADFNGSALSDAELRDNLLSVEDDSINIKGMGLDSTYGVHHFYTVQDKWVMMFYDKSKENTADFRYIAGSITEVSGDTLKICMKMLPLKSDQVPQEFHSPVGSKNYNIVFRRESAKHPKSTLDLNKLLVSGGYQSIHFLSKDDDPYLMINCSINGRTGRFVVDTGAVKTALTYQFARHCNLPKQGEVAIQRLNTTQIGHLVLVENLACGDKSALKSSYPIEAVALNLDDVNVSRKESGLCEIDGLLGSDFLSRHNAIIDFRNMAIYLKESMIQRSDRFLGNWKAISVQQNLMPMKLMKDQVPKVAILQNRFIYEFGSQKVEYILGQSVRPDDVTQFHFYPLGFSPDKGLDKFVGGAIVKREGNNLMMCLALDFSKLKFKEIPPAFEATPTTDYLLLKLEQAEK